MKYFSLYKAYRKFSKPIIWLLALFPMQLLGQCCISEPNMLATYNPDFSATIVALPPGFRSDNAYASSPTGGGFYYIVSGRNYGACRNTKQYDHTVGNSTGSFLWFDTL